MWLRLGVTCALALATAAPCGAGLIRKGRPAFDVDALSAWEGRTVGAIELQGHKVTREDVVRRQVRTQVGSPLEVATLGGDVARLTNLGAFADVRAEVAEMEAGGSVRVTFVLSETYSILPVPAVLYTEENGFSLGAGVSAPNLSGRAMKLGGKAFFGGTRQYWVTFDAPWLYRGERHRSFNAFLGKRDRQDELRGFNEDSYEVRPTLGWYFDRDRAQATVGLTYFRMTSDVPGITLSADNRDNLLGATAALVWDSRDDWGAPRRGWRNEIELTRYSQVDGPASFWRLNLDARRWVSTTPRQKVMLSGLLTAQTGKLGTDVPQYMDFYVGGANTVRGYDSTDRPIVGKNQLLGTAEYSLVLMQPRRWDLWFLSMRIGLEATAFGDLGVAWSDSSDLTVERTRGGGGVGLRLLVPGSEMVRFDLAWSEQQGFRFHFATGSKPYAQRQRLR
jgi:outer membrane protein assembly factor BamA